MAHDLSRDVTRFVTLPQGQDQVNRIKSWLLQDQTRSDVFKNLNIYGTWRSQRHNAFIIDLSSTFNYNHHKIMDTSTINRNASTFRSRERPISTVFPSTSSIPSDSVLSATSVPASNQSPASAAEIRDRCLAGNITLKKKLGYRLFALKQFLRTWVS